MDYTFCVRTRLLKLVVVCAALFFWDAPTAPHKLSDAFSPNRDAITLPTARVFLALTGPLREILDSTNEVPDDLRRQVTDFEIKIQSGRKWPAPDD